MLRHCFGRQSFRDFLCETLIGTCSDFAAGCNEVCNSKFESTKPTFRMNNRASEGGTSKK